MPNKFPSLGDNSHSLSLEEPSFREDEEYYGHTSHCLLTSLMFEH